MTKETYQTDIGRIPVGWKPYRVGELVSFSGGSQPDKSTFKFRPVKGYIRLIQIRDYKTDKYETYIPEVLGRKTCDEHDVMIGRYGPPIFQILRGIKGAYNVALIKTIPSNKLDKEFFYHFIKNEKLFNLMESLSRRSSGQTGVELSALREYPLPLPTKEEQKAIANALSDVDTLITSLESLITKKRAIKTAAMQQLLTGKKRLPPFDKTHTGYKQTELGVIPEDWSVVKLGDVLEKIIGGGTPSRSNAAYWGGEIPWVTVKDFATFDPQRSQEYITKSGLQNSSSNLVPSGTLITSTRMALGKAVIYDVPVAINQDLKAIIPKKFVSTEFLCYWFDDNAEMIDEMGSGSTVKGLSLSDLKSIEFRLPPQEEQTAVANVLGEMDKDIDALERRLTKTQQLKQGMMQELLTGKTRLV